MDRSQRILALAIYCVVIFCFTRALQAQSPEGLWDATVSFNGVSIPFQFEISGKGRNVQSYFFNGDDKVNPSSSGSFQNGTLTLQFDSYAAELKATYNEGILAGTFAAAGTPSYEFQARKHDAASFIETGPKAPDISGLWEIQVQSPKGEAAWRFMVNQTGNKVSATILRVDGDTGTLSGTYKDGKFSLSHFTGERPLRVEVIPEGDGGLQVEIIGFRAKQTRRALRPEVARAKSLAPPADFTQHTKIKNASEPLQFSFPDINGQLVSNTDQRFQGKVVLVNITGSWCPNCHDEAPFLEEIYRKYHSQGLEIVALDFEQEDQLKDLARLKAFIKRYGIDYTYLVAGEPDQLNQKLPQAENLNSWPTTFFVGRNGLVRSVHTGFTSRGSGTFDTRLKDEITQEVVQLLSEHASAANNARP